MRYRRALLLVELGADPAPALTATRRLAPGLERLVVVAAPPAPPFTWWPVATEGPVAPAPAPERWLETLRADASRLAASTEVCLRPQLDPAALAQLLTEADAELVVAGPTPPSALAALSELRKRHPVATLWVPPGRVPDGDVRPFTELLCVALGARAEAEVARFLRDHGTPQLRVKLLTLSRPSPGELAAALEVSGVHASVELADRSALAPWTALGTGVDLVVLPRLPGVVLRSARLDAPVLVLPPATQAGPAVQRPLDVPDLVELDGVVRARVGYAYGVGRNPLVEEQPLAFVASGRQVAVVTPRGGEAVLPPGLEASSVGVYRVREGAAPDPVAAVERRVALLHPGTEPLVLFDAELPDAELRALARASGAQLLAVRMLPVRSCHLVRERLRTAGLAPHVVDASAVLDEGHAADVSEAQDAVRLARVALRLREGGFPVVAVVFRGPHAPETHGFEALRARELEGRAWAPPAPLLPRTLDTTTGATLLEGNRVELELDNARARRWLLEEIARAQQRVHLQTYMAADDDVGRQLEAALAEAAGRGVAVRVLVDSLHGLHGSLGLRNPLLERLAAHPGVELRVIRPVEGVPSLEELKVRDHRKLVVVDGRVALLGGRNVAHEYFTGFDEVPVTAATPWRQVPWLDAGARVEGPAVGVLEGAFREAWTEAGGGAFDVAAPPAAGPTAARVVVHRGLRDAHTLEAYLALVDSARSHLCVLTGFPLLLELQHALVRAVHRGVRVRALFGQATPSHGSVPFEGEWAAARTLATWLVHSRMDALVAAGGEASLFAVRDVPGWAPDLGPVYPHVHAKALSVDGRACALGSANLDVTASYWESELLLVVEDAALAGAFEARVDALLAGSVRVDRDDPAWQRLARRREWLRYWPGVLSV